MSAYPKPLFNTEFNVSDFTYEESEALTEYEAKQLFIRKNGFDTVKSTLVFNGSVTLNDVLTLNNLTKQQLSYLDNINEDVQVKIDSLQSQINIESNINDIQDVSLNAIETNNNKIDASLNELKNYNISQDLSFNSKFSQVDASLNEGLAYTDQKINQLIDNSPATLDTLNEISTALNNDPDFYNSMNTLINAKLDKNNPVFTGTLNNITIDELQTLDNNDLNIKDKFTKIDASLNENHPEEDQFLWSTGVHKGGELLVYSNTQIKITAGEATIVTDIETREHVKVSWNDIIHTVPNIASSIVHFVLLDVSANVITQYTKPTPTQLRDYIYLGVAVGLLSDGNLSLVNQQQQFISNVCNSLQDLCSVIGFLNIDNNISFLASGAIQKSAGQIFSFGVNYVNSKKSPNLLDTGFLDTTTDNVLQTRLYNGVSINPSGPPYLLPLDSWDNGSLSTMSNNKFGIGRLYLFTSNTVKFQPSQVQYSSMTEAREKYLVDAPFITEPSIKENGVLLAYLFYKKSPNYSNSDELFVLNSGKFGSVASSSGLSNLQSTYDNSIQPQIIINDKGSMQIQGFNTVNNCLEIMDENGAIVTELSKNGDISCNSDINLSSSSKINLVITEFGNNAGNGASNAVAIGTNAGNSQNYDCVAIGNLAGQSSAYRATAIGFGAGELTQGQQSTAIGCKSGYIGQGTQSTCVGFQSGYTSQGNQSTAVGYQCGWSSQGAQSLCLGYRAGYSASVSNSIILCADAGGLSSTQSGFYVKPIRDTTATNYKPLYLDTDTNEIINLPVTSNELLTNANIWSGSSNTFNNDLVGNGVNQFNSNDLNETPWYFGGGNGFITTAIEDATPKNGIGIGNADGASLGSDGTHTGGAKANLLIKSWHGVGFCDTLNNPNINKINLVISCRNGNLDSFGVFDFKGTGTNYLSGSLDVTNNITFGGNINNIVNSELQTLTNNNINIKNKFTQLDTSLNEIITTVDNNDADILAIQNSITNVDNTSDATKVANMIADNHTWTGLNTFNNTLTCGDNIDFSNDIKMTALTNGRICIGRQITSPSGNNQILMGYRPCYNFASNVNVDNSIYIGTNAGLNLPNDCRAYNNIILGSGFRDISANNGADRAYNIVCIGNEALNGAFVDSGITTVGTLSGKLSAGQYSSYYGYDCASNYISNGSRACAFGFRAGYNGLLDNAICIGNQSGAGSVASANSINLNASGSPLQSYESGLYISPVRNTGINTNCKNMYYDTSNNEIIHLDDDKNPLLASANIWDGSNNTFNNPLIASTIDTSDINATAESTNVTLFDNIVSGNITMANSMDSGAITIGNSSLLHRINIYGQIRSKQLPGAYMLNSSGASEFIQPIYNTINNLADVFNNSPGTIATGSRKVIDWSSNDDAWIIMPGYRIQVLDQVIPTASNTLLDYTNDTDVAQCIAPTSINSAKAVKLTCNGVQI